MQRVDHGQTDILCITTDALGHLTADVQCGGYRSGGKIQRQSGTGSCRLHDGTHQCIYQPVYRNLAGNQRPGSQILRSGKIKRNVRNRPYIHHAGTDQRCGDGSDRPALFPLVPGNHGNPGRCDRTGNLIHENLFSGHAIFHAV